MFHPGGMDYDGRYLWVPVAEYRPNSQTRIYRVNPRTLAAELVFTAKDHIGGLVHNVHRGTLHGVELGLTAPLYVGFIARRASREGFADELGSELRGPTSTTRTATITAWSTCSAAG